MTAQTETVVWLRCPQGHRWPLPEGDTVAAGQTPSCPTCGEAGAAGLFDVTQISAPQPKDERPVVPGYELLEELGRGGMAVVFKARQQKPQRIVALKILHHPASGDTSWIARFRSEAEAVAQLEHPHIVRMYEVGEAQRLSYLALEFVDGGNLATRLQGRPQNPRASAEMIATLARAMHFAHQRGIVHRDLKPANILLQATDGVPRITDFGLAKRLDDDGQQTRTGDILGTPSYMAPEQATGVTRKFGPACDIHAMGVILYEMLTGRQPFRGEDVMETLRLVASADPVPPRRLNAEIPRDLETICLKCLEKLPKQRYASAAALAEDLQRYLNGETILTRPAGPLEKTYKWTRRHPAAALALAIAFLVPLMLVAGLLSHNWRISKELANTARQRNRAEANLQETQVAIDKLLTEISSGRLSALPRSAPVRRQMLEWAFGLCQELRIQNPENARLQLQSARAQRQTADIQRLLGQFHVAHQSYGQAIEQLTKLVNEQPHEPPLLRELAAAHNNCGLLGEQLGRTAEAEQDYRVALGLWQQLANKFPPAAEFQQSHAATLANLGLLLTQLGQVLPAEKYLQESIDIRQAFVNLKPNDSDRRYALVASRINLGNLHLSRGRFESANKRFEASKATLIELREVDPENAEVLAALGAVENNLAATLAALEQRSLAEEAYERSLAIFAKLVQNYPTTLTYREQLAATQLNLALLIADERQTDAEPLIQQALNSFELLANEQPDVPHFRQGTTKALQQLAAYQASKGEQTEAEMTLRQALKLQTSLAEQFPQRAEVFSQLGLIQHAAAQLLAARDADADARKYFEQAIQSQRQALAPNASALAYRLRLRDHLQSLAQLLIQQGEPAAAALAIDQLAALFPVEAERQFQAAQLLAQCLPLAATVKGQDKIEGLTAEEYCRKRCLALLRQALKHEPRDSKIIEQAPEFKPLRGDPEFQRLLSDAQRTGSGK